MKMNKKMSSPAPEQPLDFEVLNRISDRAFWMALKMIDIANNRPGHDRGEPKVGGHPSACASSQHLLAAIHLVKRKPEDYIACKPHISPMDHALNYLLHNFRDKDGNPMDAETRKLAMHHLRHYSREGQPVFQSYHAESDPDSFRYFPSGSVGIPPVNALYTALGYKFVKDHGFDLDEEPTFWCIMGDSEFREGSLQEAMPDGGDRQLGRLIWIVDYNRQNLDGTRVLNEKAFDGSDADRIVRIAEANGWRGIKLKHGKLREKLFSTPGGDEFKRVLDEEFSDFEFQALLAANQPKLTRETLEKKSSKLKTWMKKMSDEEIQAAYMNLAGHDLQSLVEAFQEIQSQEDKPTLVVAYTIKGRGLRCQALSGNHSALPEEDELVEMASKLGVSNENPFDEFSKNSPEEKFLSVRRDWLNSGISQILDQTHQRREHYREIARSIDWPVDFNITALKMSPMAHTQWMWGQIAAKLDRLAHGDGPTTNDTPTEEAWKKVAPFFLTMAPDVGTSTNTSPNMNGKLYGDIEQEDYELLFHSKDQKAPDIVPHANKRTGHIRFEIAEGNCMSAAGSFGKFDYFTGLPFFPAMTIYDFFIKRAHDQFYYNLYWHSHFVTLGTPSGVTLAPEGAQHSWKSDFQIPHCVTWEPAFAKELEWIFADMLRRHFTGEDDERESTLIRCVTKGLPQKEFVARLKQQPRFRNTESEEDILETVRKEVLQGAYPLIDYRDLPEYVPGDNAVHIFAMGALVTEAIKASDELKQKGIFANVFVVTSSDLLLGNFAYQNNYSYLRDSLGVTGDLHLRPGNGRDLSNDPDWYSVQGARIPIVSVHDGEPGLLDNIGSAVGVKHKTLAVRKTSKSGTTADVFYFHHINYEGIMQAVDEVLADTAQEAFRINPELLRR